MLVSNYSAPDFDPYGDREPVGPDGPWRAPFAQTPVRATVSIPGSKSLTNRELVLAALADGPSILRAPLVSRDTQNMTDALRALGAQIERIPGSTAFGPDLRVTPAELIGSTSIDCGQAGTVMRFVPPVAALALGPTTFDADASARGRPMSTMIDALRALGADLDDAGRRSLPFTVHGRGALTGGAIRINASASSQFVSGLLLSSARFEDGLDLTHDGDRLPSIPHIEMTIATLRARGVEVDETETGRWRVAPQPVAGATVHIEPDLSNAAPFLAAAVITGGTVAMTGWPEHTTQVGAELERLLPLFGAEVHRSGDRLTVVGPQTISGIDLDLTVGGELAPTLVALAALADGPSEIRGIGHIRHHETDRLAALATEICALGGEVSELDDGLRIVPRPLSAGLWHSYNDHRMATTGALLGLVVDGVTVENIGTTAKTLPEFPQLWARMLAAESPAAIG